MYVQLFIYNTLNIKYPTNQPGKRQNQNKNKKMQGNNFTVLHCFVFQVDGPYAAVKFPPKDSALQAAAAALSTEEASGSLLQDVRLLRKDELQVTAING